MKNNLSKNLAKGMVSILNKVLQVEANSASCVIMHQPKAPERLAEFRKTK